MDISKYREANSDINPIFIERWSPRSFSSKEVEEEKLSAVFEAARWAPSAANLQPWRFIVAKTDADRETFQSFINEGNVEWCKNAPVLVAILSMTTRNEKGDPNVTHAFDAGTAWGYLTLEAKRQGLITHGMGGFDRKKAKDLLEVPEEYDVPAIFALGYYDPTVTLPEHHEKREKPSGRNPIESFVFEGKFAT